MQTEGGGKASASDGQPQTPLQGGQASGQPQTEGGARTGAVPDTQVPELALSPLPAPGQVAQQKAPSPGYISQKSEAGKREVILKVIWP